MGLLDPQIRDLAQAANFAAFTVRLGSGDAMTHVMWVDADDDHVLINTEVHRAKFKAVERDPRVTVTIWVKDDPYTYGEVRGRVVADDPWPRGSCAYRRALAEVPGARLRPERHHLGARDLEDRARGSAQALRLPRWKSISRQPQWIASATRFAWILKRPARRPPCPSPGVRN